MRLLGAFARGAGFEPLRHFGAAPRYFRDTERARQIEEGGEEWHERGDDRGERGDTGEEGSARRKNHRSTSRRTNTPAGPRAPAVRVLSCA